MVSHVKQVGKDLAKWYFSRQALPYWCISLLDFCVVLASMAVSYVLVYGPFWSVSQGSTLLYTFLTNMIFYVAGFRIFHTYADVFRFIGFRDLARTVYATGFGTVMGMAFRFLVDMLPWTTNIPYRVFVFTFLSSTIVLWILRIVMRNLFDMSHENLSQEVELLPRREIDIDMEKVGALLKGKKVLITGAAGSIGSEMVRQIAPFHPEKMILIDQAETPMHDLMLEVKKNWGFIETRFIVATIANRERMAKVFGDYKPDYVFHAAAYKHVPMMEENPSVSVMNNILGTRILADIAVLNNVKKFVMISTDKAVNPTNVMGCSKRICEIYVQSLNAVLHSDENTEHKVKLTIPPTSLSGVQTPVEVDAKSATQFITTRFGNVLGSNGSVIPLFKKQIEEGGPITVTHPDITRFFMLIPEACKLVLEAGTMGHGGEVFVFDMGDPVKIVDLAQRMIRNSGRHNIKIEFTGLREGEKLYEEVLFKGEEEKDTDHPKIRIAKVREYEYDTVCRLLDELNEISKTFDEMKIVRQMKIIVPEFKSNNSKYEAVDRELERVFS